MSDFLPVARLSQLSDPGKLVIEVEGRFVVLVCIDGEIFCVEDNCTHDGGTLGDGDLEDHCLVCARHGAKFDVRTGNAIAMPATEPTIAHDVKVVGEQIYVKLRAEPGL